MSWITIYTNYSFALYTFPYAHFEDDDECGSDFTANNWIFNTPSISAFLNYSFISIVFNNFAS
jgi:hypothetical protein